MTDELVVFDRTVLHLVFEDPRMGGLEIRVRSCSIGEWQEAIKSEESLQDKFAECLISWTLGKRGSKGKAVKAPLTRQALLDELEPWQYRTVMTQWRKAVIGLPDPLDQLSPNGGPSGVEQLPMEAS